MHRMILGKTLGGLHSFERRRGGGLWDLWTCGGWGGTWFLVVVDYRIVIGFVGIGEFAGWNNTVVDSFLLR